MRRLRCTACNALLPTFGAKCGNCGLSSDADHWAHRKKRELRLAMVLLGLGLSLALAIGAAVPYLRSI